MKRVKRIKLLATRADGFKVERHFKKVSITPAVDRFWVNADGREFICEHVEIKTRDRGMGEGSAEG